MFDKNHIYSFDIETDNSAGFGLDPYQSVVTQIALSFEGGGLVFSGPEDTMFQSFTDTVNDLPPGLLSTWNGAFFDLPFLSIRAAQIGAEEFTRTLSLIPQPGLKPKYSYLPGVQTAYTAHWGRERVGHTHLDIAFAYKKFAESFGTAPDASGKLVPVVPWSLKPVCQAQGIDMFVIDRTRLHEYPPADVDRYALSDSDGTRELVVRALGA